MKQDNFNRTAGIIFLIIAVLHLSRVVQGWEANIGGFNVPMWASYLAVLIAGYLAFHGLKLSGKI